MLMCFIQYVNLKAIGQLLFFLLFISSTLYFTGEKGMGIFINLMRIKEIRMLLLKWNVINPPLKKWAE